MIDLTKKALGSIDLDAPLSTEDLAKSLMMNLPRPKHGANVREASAFQDNIKVLDIAEDTGGESREYEQLAL